MKVTETLPNDGAPFKCYRKSGEAPYFVCGKPATRLLTKEAFEELQDLFTMRAVCSEHATEAAIELDEVS